MLFNRSIDYTYCHGYLIIVTGINVGILIEKKNILRIHILDYNTNHLLINDDLEVLQMTKQMFFQSHEFRDLDLSDAISF